MNSQINTFNPDILPELQAHLSDCFTDHFGCPTDSTSKTELLILRQPQICSSRSFPHLTWENFYPSGEHLSQNSKGCSQQLLLSNHTASLRANTGAVSSKQCWHPISCLYHHYQPFGLNVATIISHLNYNSLLTGLLYSIPWSGFSAQKPSYCFKM